LEVELNGSVHLSEITLPEGVISVALSHGEQIDLNVASVHMPRGGADEDELEAAEGEEGAAEDAPGEEGDTPASEDSPGDSE